MIGWASGINVDMTETALSTFTDSQRSEHDIAHIASSPDAEHALCGVRILNIPTRSEGRCVVCADLARRGFIGRS